MLLFPKFVALSSFVLRWRAMTLVRTLCAVFGAALAAQPVHGECKLASPAEFEALAGRVIVDGGPRPHEGELCVGRGDGVTVTIRRYVRPEGSSRKVEPITCEVREASGRFNTSCTVAKPPAYAVVEVAGTVKVQVEKVRDLAGKILARL